MLQDYLRDLWAASEEKPPLRIASVALVLIASFVSIWWLLGFVYSFLFPDQTLPIKVSGQVIVQGKPIDVGTLTFVSANQAETAAVAQIRNDGIYELLIPKGEYRVAIDAKKVSQKMYPDIEKPSEEQIQLAKKTGVDLIVGYQEIDFLVPDSYRTIQTTPLSIKITNENTSYDLLIKNANKLSLLRQRLESLTGSRDKKSSKEIFLRSEGTVRGPFSLNQILPRLKAKKFTILDEISDSETGPWLPIMRSPLAL